MARWDSEFRVIDIALLPEFCNRGLGTFLMKGIMKEAAEAGKPVRIHVERNNVRALAFYERLGFAILKDIQTHLFMEWKEAE